MNVIKDLPENVSVAWAFSTESSFVLKYGKAGEWDEFISTVSTSAKRTRHLPPSAEELHF